MRCAEFQLRVWLICCFAWIGAGTLVEAQNIRSSANDQFEIVGQDLSSVHSVNDLSQHIVASAGPLLDLRRMDFPQRILVRLKPEQYVDFEGAYQITVGERGFVTLDFLWEENLSLAQCCRALSEALLLRYAYYHFGPSAAENLREWTVAALGMQALLALRPALRETLASEFRGDPLPQLESVLSRKWGAVPQERSGYWFFQSLRQSGLAPFKIREFYLAAVAGRDVSPMLTELIQSSGSGSLDHWWAQSLGFLISPQRAAFEELAVSRRWILELSEFELDEKPINLRQVWLKREDPAIRQILEARLEILRIRITRANPAYFNAARSLGLLFETMLESDEAHEFIGALSQFLGDFEDTKEVEQIVRDALRPGQRGAR
ncbi:MAG: hypothetical protein ACLFU4_08720 [Opitutales bacterium]